ncbi:MAG: Gfo/Idh/MocA family oxidoreductase [Pirellulales bacterium]
MKPLRGTMIGAGYFATFQAEAWNRLAGVEIVAVADASPGKAAEFAARFAIPRAYERVEEMLDVEQPEFVDIVTRPESHLLLTRLAAACGIHVICQKPMAPSMDDCVAMCEACERAGVRLLVHENWRWQPWYRQLKRLLADGVLGTPFQFSFFWRTGDGRGPDAYPAQPYFRQMPRLMIYESLVHILDTFRFLGGEMQVQSCQTAQLNPAIAGEDYALIVTSFESGAVGLIDANRCTGPVPALVAMGTCIVEGAEGMLRVSPVGEMFRMLPGEPEERLPFTPPDQGYKGDSVYVTQAHLLDRLRSGAPSESDGRDYLRTVALVEACYDFGVR